MRMNNRTDIFKSNRPELYRSYISTWEYRQSAWYCDMEEEFAHKYLGRFFTSNGGAPLDHRTVYKVINSTPSPEVDIVF